MYKILSIFFLVCICFPSSSPLTFTDHKGVEFLLKMMNKKVMVYHCKEAEEMIRKKGSTKLESISLKCDVLGNVANITLQHNFRNIPINSNRRYRLIAQAHRGRSENFQQYRNGGDDDYYFKNWIEYTLKILKPQPSDTGLYKIQVQSPDGDAESQIVYVDLSPYQHLLTTPTERQRHRSYTRTVKSATAEEEEEAEKKKKEVERKAESVAGDVEGRGRAGKRRRHKDTSGGNNARN